jgi:tRNA modification GTPase
MDAVALARARTVRTAGILLDQCRGALRRELGRAADSLIRGDVAACRSIFEALAATADLPLTRPARVVVAGAPNVGKSSLINALAGYQRSVVSPTPGTTRDVTTTETAIDGWPVELVDTAGLRLSEDELEAAGIARAREAVEQANLCLWLLDASAEPAWPEIETKNLRLVVNKCDLEPAWDLERAGDAPHVSAVTGAGLPELLDAVSRWLVPCPPPPGAAVVTATEVAEELASLVKLLDRGQAAEVQGRLGALLRRKER